MQFASLQLCVMHPSKLCIVGAVNDSLTLLVLERSRTINNIGFCISTDWSYPMWVTLLVTSCHPCTVCPILMFAIRQAAIISDLIYGVFMRMGPGQCYQSLYPAVPHIISTYPHTPGEIIKAFRHLTIYQTETRNHEHRDTEQGRIK